MSARFVSRPELALTLGVTERTIASLRRRYADFPARIRGRSVTFPVAACRRWFTAYQERLAAERATEERSAPLLAIEERTKAARMAMAEADVAQRMRDLLPAKDVYDEVSGLLGGIRAAIDAMPQEHAHRILHKNNTIDAAVALKEIGFHLLRAIRRVGLPGFEAPSAARTHVQ